MKVIPNFFIVGAARSGTTSLHRYLYQHPEIFLTWRKEAHFFAAHHFPCTGPGDEALNRRIISNEQEYAQLFAQAAGQKVIGEASASYLGFPDAAERIAQAVPDARILISLREPVARAYSAYMLLRRDGRETLSFARGLSQEAERKQQGWEPMWWYKELSLYAAQVKRYLEVFGRERVKVLLYEELYAHPVQVLRQVFAFLGVREDVAIDTSVRYNVAGVPRSRRLYTIMASFIEKPDPLTKRIMSLVPLPLQNAIAHKILKMFVSPVPLDAQMQTHLKASFAEEVGKLEEVLQRDLRCWGYRQPGLT